MTSKTNKNDNKIGISITEAGKRLGIGRNNMLRLAKTKTFPCIRMNKKIIVNSDKLEQWFNEQIGKTIL